MKTGFYVHEAGEYVGPFCRRTDAALFLKLMELFGNSLEGITIVEMGPDARHPEHCLRAPERNFLRRLTAAQLLRRRQTSVSEPAAHSPR